MEMLMGRNLMVGVVLGALFGVVGRIMGLMGVNEILVVLGQIRGGVKIFEWMCGVSLKVWWKKWLSEREIR
jgi:hypothetical protein